MNNELATAPDAIDEFIAQSQRLTGKERREREGWNSIASADAIRHFAYGISDDNPLWLNPEYAAQSQYGCRVAPPAFLMSVLYPVLHGAPVPIPLSSLTNEVEYEWFHPVLEGDRLHAVPKQTDVFESSDRSGRRMVYIMGETVYWNQRQEKVARAFTTLARIPDLDQALLADRGAYHYSQEELTALHEAMINEARTGNHSLTNEDIQIGMAIPPLIRGPFTVGDLVCWQAGIGPSYRAGSLGYRDCVTSPHSAVTIPGVGWPVKYSQQHEDANLHSQRGMPAPFDNGPMRFAWLSVLLTNWMGDNGFLQRLRINTVEPVLYSDTNWYRGTITKVTNTDHGAVVSLKITGTNQLGDVTTTGQAEVRLPIEYTPLVSMAKNDTDSNVYPLVQVSDAERNKLLHDWNDTVRAYPEDECFHHLFMRIAEQQPNAVALQCQGQQLTYAELNREANRLAHYLQSQGVKPDVSVGICLDRNNMAVVSMLAVLKAGGAYLPLDPEYPSARLRYMLEQAKVPLLLVESNLLPHLPTLTKTRILALDNLSDELAAHPDTTPDCDAGPDNLAYCLYTSGSTSQPKAAMIPHRSLYIYLRSIVEPLGIRADDVYLHTASFAFSAAVRQTMLPLSLGAKLLLTSSDERIDPIVLFELIKREQVTVWDTVPTSWRHCIDTLLHLAEDKRAPLLDNAVRLIMTTGEALPWQTPQTWVKTLGCHTKIINLYSQTETAGTAACYTINPHDAKSWADNTGAVPLGRPVENTRIYILDPNQNLLPIGHSGELCVAGPRIARGYIGRSEENAAKFLPDPFRTKPGEMLYRTGDIARWRSDSILESQGRSDHRVKIRGYRIELNEVEAALDQHPNVVRSAVVAREDDPDNQTYLAAYVVLKAEQQPTISDFYTFLRESLPEYMLPAAFVYLDKLPLNPNGKLDRQALPAPEHVRPPLKDEYIAPRTPTEEILVDIVENLLSVERVGVHDDFFELGGNSLLAVRLINEIQDQFDYRMPLRTLMDNTTVEKLAVCIDAVHAS